MFWGGSTRTYDCVSVGAGACLDASIAGVLDGLFAHGSIGLLYMLTLLALNLWFLFRCFYHISIPTLWNTSTSCRRRLLDAQGGCVRFSTLFGFDLLPAAGNPRVHEYP